MLLGAGDMALVNLRVSFLYVLLSSVHLSPEFLSTINLQIRYFTFEPYFKVNKSRHMIVTMQNRHQLRRSGNSVGTHRICKIRRRS
jgi:hypothetical protein